MASLKTTLKYNPTIVAGIGTGGITAAVLALLVYYGALDTQGAALWGTLATAVMPFVSGWLARFYTTSTAKVEDAAKATGGAISQDAIDAAARKTRNRRGHA